MNPRKVGRAVDFYEFINKTQINELQERQRKPVPKSISLVARRRNKGNNLIEDHGFDVKVERGSMDEEYQQALDEAGKRYQEKQEENQKRLKEAIEMKEQRMQIARTRIARSVQRNNLVFRNH